MTQPSKRFDLWRRLYDRFLIEPFPASEEGEGPAIGTTILPVTDADALLRDPDLQTSTQAQTTSAIVYYTVPAGERWYLVGYHAFRVGGDRDVNAVAVSNGVMAMNIDAFTAVSERVHHFPEKLRLETGWTIRLDGNGGTTDGNWTMEIWVEVEAFNL